MLKEWLACCLLICVIGVVLPQPERLIDYGGIRAPRSRDRIGGWDQGGPGGRTGQWDRRGRIWDRHGGPWDRRGGPWDRRGGSWGGRGGSWGGQQYGACGWQEVPMGSCSRYSRCRRGTCRYSRSSRYSQYGQCCASRGGMWRPRGGRRQGRGRRIGGDSWF